MNHFFLKSKIFRYNFGNCKGYTLIEAVKHSTFGVCFQSLTPKLLHFARPHGLSKITDTKNILQNTDCAIQFFRMYRGALKMFPLSSCHVVYTDCLYLQMHKYPPGMIPHNLRLQLKLLIEINPQY